MNESIRILMFEDNPDHEEIFLSYLGMTGYASAEVTTTPSMQKGKQLLDSADFDIIFLDLSLDDSSVVESMKSIKSLNQYGPVVVLTSLDDRETLMSVINKGAQDCLPKSELSDLILERMIHFNLDRWRLSKQLIQSEEKVRHYSQMLEQRVLERTAELEEAKEAAEEANKAKGIFIANMSHEFRTPLNAVLGFSREMLEDHTISAKYREYLNLIHHNGVLQLSLINDVLAMSSLEDGRTSLKLETLDLSKLLGDVIDKGLLAAKAKNIAFNVEYGSEIPKFINSDYEKLQQILIATINNAIKYTESGGVRLRLSSQPSDRDGNVKLNCDVEDSGIGIPIELQQHIFLPFFQVGEQDDQTGTGLGLTLAQRFLELMGGEINLESEQGKGTIFHISLPVQLSTEADFEPEELQTHDIMEPFETKDKDLQLNVMDLETLADETLTELADAVFALDVEHVLEVAKHIEEHKPELANTVVAMVNKLDFKTLQELLKRHH